LKDDALYTIYTLDGHFALIGIRSIDTSVSPAKIVFDFVYNPYSDNTYNRTLYETE
jgi:hypothetical protein